MGSKIGLLKLKDKYGKELRCRDTLGKYSEPSLYQHLIQWQNSL